MIIRQTTTIVFEYPQDYLQEQEWCKTKDDRWVHKGTDTLGAVYENQISYSIGVSADRKTEPSNSEKPNNSTISKMEQVAKDINVRSKDKPQTPYDNCQRAYIGCMTDIGTVNVMSATMSQRTSHRYTATLAD